MKKNPKFVGIDEKTVKWLVIRLIYNNYVHFYIPSTSWEKPCKNNIYNGQKYCKFPRIYLTNIVSQPRENYTNIKNIPDDKVMKTYVICVMKRHFLKYQFSPN